jgi:chorismate lyase/3-hydroxybenzoate synthase
VNRQFGALGLRRFSADEAIDEDGLLGAVTYSANIQSCHSLSSGIVPMLVLPSGDAMHMAWYAGESFTDGSFGNLHYRYDENVLFGFITLNEADFLPTDEVCSLRQASQAAYMAIFETLKKTGFAYLVRCWNYLPHINAKVSGLERYKHFNIGRQEAFIASRHSHLSGSPSACALGTAEGSMIVYFLATHAEPRTIENPRQISAYYYPDQYGPSSPTFSRAVLLPLDGMEVLFVSGTASILGHDSLHHGDVAAQTVETLHNIDIVVAQTNLKSDLGGFTSRDLCMKVYIRNREDWASVNRVMQEYFDDNINVTCLQADICRAELLVEIEAFGFRYGVRG